MIFASRSPLPVGGVITPRRIHIDGKELRNQPVRVVREVTSREYLAQSAELRPEIFEEEFTAMLMNLSIRFYEIESD